ncbi:MAG: single-stranded-DNA-specific exonuclease RecJ [Oscillospiraceae bacterium]
MPAFKRWRIKNADEAAIKELSKQLGISSLTARALTARGFLSADMAKSFLDVETEMENPLHIADIDKAAARINDAIENDEHIAIFGDYDVDGITSTTIMCMYLQSRGADVVCSLPTRESTGYGLSKTAIENLEKYKVSLIITVDNGISAYEEIDFANSLGMDVIICDHHLPADKLPNAFAAVDPLRADDSCSFKELAGVGVAFKLVCAVEGCEPDELFEEFGYLVAIGTIADIMPLKGENRTIVKRGLALLPDCDNLGLCALCEVSGTDMASLDAQGVAFSISPRINAAGRMGNAELALRLMLTDDIEEAAELAKQLEALNKERQSIEQSVAKAIAENIDSDPELTKKPVLIVSGEQLHSGVIGIVCSRLVERYGKPVIVISYEGNNAKGSGRSVRGFSLYDAISSCSDILQKFGGHELAAGFTLDTGEVESFKERIFEYCRQHTYTIQCPELKIDGIIELGEISERAVSELGSLAPFGRSNEEPVFAIKDAVLSAVAPMGDRHSRITIKQGDRTIAGALFSTPPSALPFKVGDKLNAAFTLSIFSTPNRDCVSVKFRDIAPCSVCDDTYDSISAYRCFCAGRELNRAERALLVPNREDVAYVYRKIKSEPFDRRDIAQTCIRFGELTPGKTEVILDILLELGHIEQMADGAGIPMLSASKNPEKRELASSEIFRILSEERQ